MKVINTMVAKSLPVIMLSYLAFSTSLVHAATEQRYNIELKADIPALDFHVVPVNPGWINKPQELIFDFSTKRLLPLTKSFQFKANKAIQASLTNTNAAGKTVIFNGTTEIPLTVKFNSVVLTKTAAPVVIEALAKTGGRTDLLIQQEADAPLTQTGSFTGNLAIVFEPVT